MKPLKKKLSQKKEESEETLFEMAKAARKSYKKKKIETPTPSLFVEKPSSPSRQDEEVEVEEIVEEELKEAPSRKRRKGKDITILASALKAQNLEKMALRPLSRAKYFDFDSLKTKG